MLREMKEPFDCVVNMEALAFTLDKVLCLLSDIADLAAENMVYPDTRAAWREVELRTDMAADYTGEMRQIIDERWKTLAETKPM